MLLLSLAAASAQNWLQRLQTALQILTQASASAQQQQQQQQEQAKAASSSFDPFKCHVHNTAGNLANKVGEDCTH
jgi:hypothetical protein